MLFVVRCSSLANMRQKTKHQNVWSNPNWFICYSPTTKLMLWKQKRVWMNFLWGQSLCQHFANLTYAYIYFHQNSLFQLFVISKFGRSEFETRWNTFSIIMKLTQHIPVAMIISNSQQNRNKQFKSCDANAFWLVKLVQVFITTLFGEISFRFSSIQKPNWIPHSKVSLTDSNFC